MKGIRFGRELTLPLFFWTKSPALLINFAGGRGIHAGASGAIWGLMTATLIYNLRNNLNPTYALRGIVINLIFSVSAGVSWQGISAAASPEWQPPSPCAKAASRIREESKAESGLPFNLSSKHRLRQT